MSLSCVILGPNKNKGLKIMRIPYTMFRLPKKYRKLINIVTIVLAIPIVAPLLLAWIQSYFESEPIWFNRWFDFENETNAFITGPYLALGGILLYLIGLIVGDETLEYGQNTDFDEAYNPTTSFSLT